MKQYEKYKDSGIEWLGEIPEHWKSIPFKHCVDINNGRDYKHIISEKGYPVFGSGGIFAQVSEFLYDGEVILLGRKGTIDKPLHYCGKLWAVDTMFYAIPNALSCGRYFYYQALGFPFDLYSTSTALPSMTQTDLNNHIVSVPSYAEQRKIAEYLDYTVGRVDEIVSGKQVQIDRLMDYRKSMINEVVTKGLNPDAPMRDSGIEWLGEIPMHWKATKIKYVTTKIGSGVTPTGGADVYQDSGVLFLRSQNVYDDGLRLDDVAYISDEIDNSMTNSRVMDKDVLLNITGASMGRCSFANNLGRANVNQHVCILRPNTSEIYYKYLHLLICSQIGQHQIALVQTGGNREGLNFENIKNFFIPIFSIEEQTEIVNHLEERTTKIDKIVKELTSQIEKLKEYKTSIISEAVTGKIDLREWEEPNNN